MKFKTFLPLLMAAAVVGNATAVAALSDVLATTKNSGRFTILNTAIEAAGLQAALDSGSVTLMAPTDEAFGKLPAADLQALLLPENKDKLIKILSYHVIAGQALDQERLKRKSTQTTAEGSTVKFALVNGRLRVEGVEIKREYTASNGFIQSIDRVLMPK